jgi:hypothetical protein
MRKIVLTALFAAGIGLAGVAGAAAAPASPTLNDAAPGITLYTPAQVVIVGPRRYRRHRHRVCRPVRRCYYTRHHRRVCSVRTVCYWRY